MKPLTFLAAAALMLVLPLAVDAARFERGEIITVSPSEYVPDNVYMAGGQVTFSTTGQKDVIGAGGKVLLNGPVWGDLLFAGGTVDVLEGVRGDVRVVGGQVTIQGIIGGDVIVAGGAVTILPGTTIAGDFVALGGAVIMEGTINGSAKLYGGEVRVNGTIAGPTFITVQEKVVFGEKAVLGSSVTYRSPTEADIASGAKLGVVTYVPLDIPQVDRDTLAALVLGLFTAFVIAKLIALAVASMVAVSYAPRASAALARATILSFPSSFVWGLAALIVTPIVGVILVVTVLGAYLGILLFAVYGLVLLLSGVYTAVVAGALVAKVWKKDIRIGWKWSLLGAVLVTLVGLVPILGWLAVLVLYVATVGALVTTGYTALKSHA